MYLGDQKDAIMRKGGSIENNYLKEKKGRLRKTCLEMIRNDLKICHLNRVDWLKSRMMGDGIHVTAQLS